MFNFEEVEVDLNSLNFIFIPVNNNLFDNSYNPICNLLPRKVNELYQDNIKDRRKDNWTFKNSVFFPWKQEEAELINLAFEYDWDCGKI